MKKTLSLLLLSFFLIATACSNVGKPAKKHHKGPKINASGKMAR